MKIVDEFTGRILEGRRWSEGLHQAVEAKEGVRDQGGEPDPRHDHPAELLPPVRQARRHDRHGADRGRRVRTRPTTWTCVPIPTNQPMVRVDQRRPDLQDRGGQVRAVVDDIAERHEKGQPVLVGTTRSRSPSTCRSCCEARHPARGAERQAARAGGGDRRPGRPQRRGHRRHQHGRPRRRHPARRQPRGPRRRRSCAAAGCDPVETPRGVRGGLADGARAAMQDQVRGRGTRRSSRLGGLYVLGTERHETRRIDNQLRGRSGRQGDPGESRFYLSLEDELMRLFAASVVEWVMNRRNLPDDVPIEAKMVTKAIERADASRAAQRRDPQERAQVRRGDERAAQGHLQSAARSSTARTCASRSEHMHRRRGRRLVDGATAEATPRTGTSTSCGRRSSRSTRSASPSTSSSRTTAATAT